MAIKLVEIPIIEDIYDFDTITLREATQKVQATLQQIEQLENKEPQHLIWEKKANRYLELASNEIEERKHVENFGNICVDNGQNDLNSFYLAQTSGNASSSDSAASPHKNNDFNNKQMSQPFGKVEDWIKVYEQLSEPQPSKKKKNNGQLSHNGMTASIIKEEEEENSEDECDQVQMVSAPLIKKPTGIRNHSHASKLQEVDLGNESIVSGKSFISAASSQAKYLSHQKRMHRKQKQNDMQEFIRQTLERTKITSTNGQNVNFTSTGGARTNFNSDESDIIQKKSLSSTGSQVVQQRQGRRSEDRVFGSNSSNEYGDVQSKVKQELEEQRLKKLLDQNYYSTGKSSYPKYKPPPEKKLDPQEEKEKRTKNFLRKQIPTSIQLPPISQKLSKSVETSHLAKQSVSPISDHSPLSYQHPSNSRKKLNPNQKLKPLNLKTGGKKQEGLCDDQSPREDFIKEEISEHSQEEESDDGHEKKNKKSIPGQPRKISKGEQMRIKNGVKSKNVSRSKISPSKQEYYEDSSRNKEDILQNDIIEEDIIIQQVDQNNNKLNTNQQTIQSPLNKEGKLNQESKDYYDGKQTISSKKGLEISSDDKQNEQQQKQEDQQVINQQNTINQRYAHLDEDQTDEKDNNNNNNNDKKERDDNAHQFNNINQSSSTTQLKEVDGKKIVNNESEQKIIPPSSDEENKRSNDLSQRQDIQNQEDSMNLRSLQKPIPFSQLGTGNNLQNGGKNSNQQQQKEQVQLWPKREEENPDDSDDDLNEMMKESQQQQQQGNDTDFQNNVIEKEGQINNDAAEPNNEFQSMDNNERQQLTDNQIDENGEQHSNITTEKFKDKMNSLIKGLDEIDQNENVQNLESQNSISQTPRSQTSINKSTSKNKNHTFGKSSVERANSSSASNLTQETSNPKIFSSQSDSNLLPDFSIEGVKVLDKKKKIPEQLQNQQNNLPNSKQDNEKEANSNPVAIQKKKTKQQKAVVSETNKQIIKMMKEINDDSLINYTQQIPTFSHLFSGYYNALWCASNPMIGGNVSPAPSNFCLLENMKEIYSLFQQHVEKVDNSDKGLLRFKSVITSLEVLPSEIYYINDPQKVAVYQNRVNIDIRKFIERQIILTQRMNGENFAGHLLPHEEFYFRVVKNKPEVYDIISRSFMRKREWFELPHGLQLKTSWNLLWTWSKPQIDFNKLLLFQKVNHFPFNKNLVRKDLLKKNFERVIKLGPKAASAFSILPLTFVLPKEYCNFSERFYEEMLHDGEQNNIWIMKPVGKSQGRGISLVNDLSQVVYAEPVVVQKYMKDPLLLDGYKFDMRIYVLVTHMKPLEAFVYKEGFARLSTEKYELNPQNIHNNQIHLTNYSIQKHHYDASAGNNFIGGTKISLKMLQEKLQLKNIQWDKIWIQVQEVIIKSLLACQIDIPNNPNCFEIFGYDIIIDSQLKCVLLEINSSPSLARDFIIDDLIKQQMIDDAIDLLQPVQFDRLRLLEVLERRIKEEQGNKGNSGNPVAPSISNLQLNRDLNYILRGKKLRTLGETPANLGQWQQVAPSEILNKYQKIIQSYKLPSVRQNTGNAGNNNNTID